MNLCAMDILPPFFWVQRLSLNRQGARKVNRQVSVPTSLTVTLFIQLSILGSVTVHFIPVRTGLK